MCFPFAYSLKNNISNNYDILYRINAEERVIVWAIGTWGRLNMKMLSHQCTCTTFIVALCMYITILVMTDSWIWKNLSCVNKTIVVVVDLHYEDKSISCFIFMMEMSYLDRPSLSWDGTLVAHKGDQAQRYGPQSIQVMTDCLNQH